MGNGGRHVSSTTGGWFEEQNLKFGWRFSDADDTYIGAELGIGELLWFCLQEYQGEEVGCPVKDWDDNSFLDSFVLMGANLGTGFKGEVWPSPLWNSFCSSYG